MDNNFVFNGVYNLKNAQVLEEILKRIAIMTDVSGPLEVDARSPSMKVWISGPGLRKVEVVNLNMISEEYRKFYSLKVKFSGAFFDPDEEKIVISFYTEDPIKISEEGDPINLSIDFVMKV